MEKESPSRAPLEIILEKKPGFFIRWGLVLFVVVAVSAALLFYYSALTL